MLSSHTRATSILQLDHIANIRTLPPTTEYSGNHNQAGITEVVVNQQRDGKELWLLPMLAQLNVDDRWFTWVAPPNNLEKDWLLTVGIDLNKCILLKPCRGHDVYNLSRRALRQGNCHLVVNWPEKEISSAEYEGLEQAALDGDSHCILIRTR
ncbi:SulA-like leucine-rich domain-containing protein [Pokkaliibacter sp. MBI-7]|uniref:cell division inhibitor SulA n=1 Tax=Pokkaliibacter sp. MBI-7 TaxID=3040600 RepID=UPI00244C4D1E|nr:SulA-like leucine-rich domain-containing protein [Pokkaliibacter sp. MBI-7]MDH2436096.1 SulA-like leucine-rich domain-containing protein [Pokkaliibacter sp. MBI-7]